MNMANQTQRASRKTRQATAQTKRGGSRAKAKPQSANLGSAKKMVGQLQEMLPVGSKALTSLPARTALSRLAGERPSRPRAIAAAGAAAMTGAVLVYRLLRAGD
jgi:hypothetical protein